MKPVFFAFFLSLFSATAFSSTWDNAKGVGLSFSALKPRMGEKEQAAVGTMFGGNLKYGISPHLILGLDAGYGSFRPVIAGSSYEPDENSPFETSVIPVQLSVRVGPSADSRIKPYMLFGAGVLLWDLKKNDESVYDQQTDFNYAMGLGIEWFMTQSLALDFLLRSSTYPGIDKDNVGFGQDINREKIEGRISLNLYLDQNLDRDGDGIRDKDDAAVLEAEDFDGFQDLDGAPEPDNDNDGVLDADDAAPLEPEDKDGFQDLDGVPDPDNDGDGILDASDQAPNKAEDKDGFMDEDGVPDPDNDGDGILDASDKCPNEAETVNGYMDDDGCPDVKPVPALEKAGAALVLEGVTFNTGSADLTDDSGIILDKVIVGLKDNPDVFIEVRGYTDNVGREASNQQLSEKRAVSVRQYLIDQGISADRLTAVGYGEESPIASNDTPEGRGKNRRIEFYRVK
jgi:outer membrane protein OmpA-like peptidoglycan-associated protein/opacity protein-like surface antigen